MLARQRQLAIQAVELLAHVIETVGEIAQLVAVGHLELAGELAVGDIVEALVHSLYGHGEGFRSGIVYDQR